MNEFLTDTSDPISTIRGSYRVGLATTSTEIRDVQRLRDQVFTGTGALTPGPAGIDADQFDDDCDHLIVWRRDEYAQRTEEAIATYRLLPPRRNHVVPGAEGLYSAREFDLSPLTPLLPFTVEAGRACVRPDERSGTAIALLWSAIFRYMRWTGNRFLLGCACVSLAGGGGDAAACWDVVRRTHQAPRSQRCLPRKQLQVGHVSRPAHPVIPPLFKAYLQWGAVVCGPPAVDEKFGTADFLLLLDLQNANTRYLRRAGG